MSDENILDVKIDEDGKVHCDPAHVALAMECVFPLCAQGSGKKWRFIGTAFFINHFGVFVTAKHVIKEFLDGRSSPEADALCGFLVMRDNTVALLRVLHACSHLTADVAVGRLELLQHRETGAIRPTMSFPLTLRPASIGQQAFTFAYPQTEVNADQSPQKFQIAPWFFDGAITRHFPSGRDRVMLPGNVYETSMVIKGGASGGPVYDENGDVFAINSTGIDGTDISYVSSIFDIMHLVVCDVTLPDGSYRDTITIRELVELGEIQIA